MAKANRKSERDDSSGMEKGLFVEERRKDEEFNESKVTQINKPNNHL